MLDLPHKTHFISFVYGNVFYLTRCQLWHSLSCLGSYNLVSLSLIRDFNVFFRAHEKLALCLCVFLIGSFKVLLRSLL